MDTSQYILGLSTQILAFVGFLATFIAIITYLNPGPEYITFADLVGQARQTWIQYEGQGVPTDDLASLSQELERSAAPLLCRPDLPYRSFNRLEDDVRDLWFVVNQKSIGSRIRAWMNSFRIKRLSTRARLLRIGLPVRRLIGLL